MKSIEIDASTLTTPFGSIGYRAYKPADQSNQGRQTPLLVFFHQTPSTSLMFESLMKNLGTEYACLALDTPGFGYSELTPHQMDRKQWSFDVLGQGLVWGIQFWLKKTNRTSHDLLLIGHHTGASIASWVGMQLCPSIPLVLIGPPSIPVQELEPFLRETQDLEDRIAKELTFLEKTLNSESSDIKLTPLLSNDAYFDPLWSNHPLWTEEVSQNLLYALQKKDRHLPLHLARRELHLRWCAGLKYPAMYRAVWQDSFLDRLTQHRGRVLLIGAEEDRLIHYMKHAASALMNATEVQTRTIPQVGGYLCDTHPALVARILHTFIRNLRNHQSI